MSFRSIGWRYRTIPRFVSYQVTTLYDGIRPLKLHRLNRRRRMARAERLCGHYVAEHGALDLSLARSDVLARGNIARVSRATRGDLCEDFLVTPVPAFVDSPPQ